MSFHHQHQHQHNNQVDQNVTQMQLNNVSCWSDDDDDDIEDLKGNHTACPLCSFVDESKDGPMAWMRHMYNSNVCTTGATELYRMLAQGYHDMFYTPMMQRGITMPDITAQQVSYHFRKHETSSIFTLKQDIRRIEQMQRVLMPRRMTDDGTRYIDREQMNAWLQLSKAKQDAIKLMEIETRHANGTVQQSVAAPNLEETANTMLASNLC